MVIPKITTMAIESMTLSATHNTLPDGKWELLDGSRFNTAPEFLEFDGMVFKLQEVIPTEEANTDLWNYEWYPRSAMKEENNG